MAEFSLLFEEELRLTCSSENLANMKKRGREDMESNLASMAKCLMLLSQGNITNKTCNRKFPSFQALGGHRASHMKSFQALGGYRASHRKSRLMGGDGDMLTAHNELVSKPKTHDCSICRLEFTIGQALGGHMRRHRATINKGSTMPSQSFTILGDRKVPTVLKRLNSSRKVLCLDLNLTPTENDLELMSIKPTRPFLYGFI
ncbi:hypothetical protein GIB67_018956 [Kingdonia uniflora]|uniref:C2H2-type domain-containing protein n=1 Tax=Kingdonia uniflora TaxID=39325 RepID=A0A7J7N5M0_9MAGN|nr:hypothetical protein GIB67_018956 [Kingdonia uniflora]